MVKAILVPLDGSPLAESILPTVCVYGQLLGAEITLFSVVESNQRSVDSADSLATMISRIPVSDPSRATMSPNGEPEAAERQHAYLIEIARRVAEAGLTVHTQLGEGAPAEAILAVAPSFNLIAMATHGRSGIGRWVYGSVTSKVLLGAPGAVLLVRAREEASDVVGPPKRVLVALDGSSLAEQALPPALRIAEQAGASLTLVQSIAWTLTLMADPAGFGAATVAADIVEQAEADARAYLQDICVQAHSHGVSAHPTIRTEPAADAILACAAEQQADLIVMSTHGRSGVGRWMIGSVAERVLHGATVPVWLVRNKATGAAS